MPEKKQPLNSSRQIIKAESSLKSSEPPLGEREATYTGIGASKGIVIGTCYTFVKEEGEHDNRELNDKTILEEIERFHAALSRSEKELKKIEKVTTKKLGKSYSNLFQAQIMMLHDPVLVEAIATRIQTERKPAHQVIAEEFDQYLDKFHNSEELIFQERADDLSDIKDRIIRNRSEDTRLNSSHEIPSRMPSSA